MQQGVINDKIQKFISMSDNHDNVLVNIQQIGQELDLVRGKLQVIKGSYNSSEFIMMTGTCFRKDRHMIEKLIFRKTQGHSYIVFKNRQANSNHYSLNNKSYISNNNIQKGNSNNQSAVSNQNNYQNSLSKQKYGNSNLQRDMFMCFVNKAVYKNISSKLNSILLLNHCVLYQLPNQQDHLNSYQQQLNHKIAQHKHLLLLSTQHFTHSLRELVNTQQTSLAYHLVRVAFLGRIVHIITHSQPIGSTASHHLLTIHVPQHQTLPQLPVPLIPVQGKHKPRTVMPVLPCLIQANALVQLYATPRYNQILPGVFVFITVPVLFGMMFSDMGHGLLLLALSYFFSLGPLFYLMAVMSIYCGFIYNQFLGMKVLTWTNLGIIQSHWGTAENGMNFENSLKMKLSMVMAFLHMSFGAILKMVNQHKRGQTKHLIYDSLPKFILMLTSVGYLVWLIVAKWLTDYSGRTHQAPSIINTVLDMYLGFRHQRSSILGSLQTQKQVASCLNSISVVCLLVMTYNHTLRHKFQAFYSKSKWNKNNQLWGKGRQVQQYQHLEQDQIDQQISMELQQTHARSNQSLTKTESYYYEQEEIHSQLGPLQVFEYVLSLISSTTSYLRLFALSLAHAKLSSLLLDFLLSSLSSSQPSVSLVRSVVFFGATVGMMLMLDVMECIMHVVRLHWVEWMGKFFTGGGLPFTPEQTYNIQ